MSEAWERSLFPIIKRILEERTDEEQLSYNQINMLSNMICQEFDKKYIIEKR